MAKQQKLRPEWKVHTANLLKEILNNPGTGVLRIPLLTLSRLLIAVAERAAQLNDPILNDLMCRLTLYEIADPEKKSYNPLVVDEIHELAEAYRRREAREQNLWDALSLEKKPKRRKKTDAKKTA